MISLAFGPTAMLSLLLWTIQTFTSALVRAAAARLKQLKLEKKSEVKHD
jgi:hypothetical protein